MKIKFVLLILIFFVILDYNPKADELDIVSDNIKISEDGNKIQSTNSKAIIEKKKLYLQANKSVYKKDKQKIYLEGNVVFLDKSKNIKINTQKANYDQKKDVLTTLGKTIINFEDKYEIISSNMVYDRNLQLISSDKETTIEDYQDNIYNIQNKFKLNLVTEIISASIVNVVDDKNNIFYFENSKIDLLNKEIVGKELKIDFVDNYFGNNKNDPILKGRSATSNDNETKIYKTVFSTCNTENKSCPGWEIETEEFTHDKINKSFKYKNSWLKIFDKEIFYFPFFSHPDPTVKRKSGFLPATYGSSNNYGSWVNTPYFKVIDIDKDFTFKPRIYLDDKFILQSEYRQAFENSNLISDFSYNNDGKNTNSHFFAKSTGKTKKGNNFNFQYQSVTNDEYLKLHNLSGSSKIIDNESLLTSKFYINSQIDENTSFSNDFIVYEDLSSKESDRFHYIFPNFNFSKKIEIDNDYQGNFYFRSSGYQQQYNTNNYQAVITNDFLYDSDVFVSSAGLKSNYQFLIKHDNSFTSTAVDDEDASDLYQAIMLRTEYPLFKKTDKFRNYLKPIFSARISPNNSKNLSGNDLRLTYDNIFSFNRIGSNRNIEEGRSIALGIEYNLNDNNDKDIFKFAIANSISDKKSKNLPSKSKLDQTRSDFVGKMFYKPLEILDLNYNFSYDRDFKNSNYQSFSTNLNFEFFKTSFDYLSQDNNIGDVETISNTTSLKFNNENLLKFVSTKNLKTDFTEFYNLLYKYETDCLIASVEYQKKFYKDGNILPDKSLLFYLRFIPFAELRPQATDFK